MTPIHIGPLDRPVYRVLAALIIVGTLAMVVYVPLSAALFGPLLAWKLVELWPVIAWQRERPRRLQPLD